MITRVIKLAMAPMPFTQFEATQIALNHLLGRVILIFRVTSNLPGVNII